MSAISAYEKMLKNGTANKPIQINQPTPDNEDGGMGINQNPVQSGLGESKEDTSWNAFDSQMEEYIKTKRSSKKTSKKPKNESTTIKKLEQRIMLLEGIVEKIMKAQMELLK